MRQSKKITGLFVLLTVLLSSCIALRDADDIPDPIRLSPPSLAETEADEVRPMTATLHASADAVRTPQADPAETALSDEPAASIPIDSLYRDVRITFLATGDNLIHPNIYIDASYRGTAEKPFDFLPMYEHIASQVASVDYAFINQETVMAGEGYANTGYPTFNSPQQLGRDLVTLGFDLIGMANNHMLDKGVGGLAATMDFWDSQPVMTLGAYRDEADASTTRILETDGVKIAFLAYTYGTNGIVKPASSPLVVPYIDDARITADLARAEEEADFTIVSIHWGDENTQVVNNEQKRLASLIAENGADLILGHHSHTLQTMETITTSDGREVFCVYSLGNLVSGMARPVNQVGGLLTFAIVSDGKGGLMADEFLFTPTVFYYGMDWYDTKLYLLTDYTAEIAAGHGVQISGYSLSPEKAWEYVTNVIPADYLAANE